MLFREINNQAVISRLFTIAGYTYGPLLGLFAFGLFTKHQIKDRFVPWVALLAPLLTLYHKSKQRIPFQWIRIWI